MSRWAAIRLNVPNVMDKTMPFLILRACHYLSEYRQVDTLYLDCPLPEFWLIEIQASLQLRKRTITLHQSWPSNVAQEHRIPLFSGPDYPMLVENSGIIPLGIPKIPALTDFHLHTHLAYCSENMDLETTIELERLSGVEFINFSEHSGQLYCTPDTYWNNRFCWSKRKEEDDRTAQYRRLAEQQMGCGLSFGLELDVDSDGMVSDIPDVSGFRIGAVHFLGNNLSFEDAKVDFLYRLDALLESGIDIFAHPFRVFAKSGLPIPYDLFNPVAERLVRYGVAAEINFHTNRPHPEFVESVLKKGGKISFGTDSHNLYEAGFLKPHYEFCQQLGIAGKLDEILISAAERRILL